MIDDRQSDVAAVPSAFIIGNVLIDYSMWYGEILYDLWVVQQFGQLKWVALFSSDSSRGFWKESGDELECIMPISRLNLDLFENQLIDFTQIRRQKHLRLIRNEFVNRIASAFKKSLMKWIKKDLMKDSWIAFWYNSMLGI